MASALKKCLLICSVVAALAPATASTARAAADPTEPEDCRQQTGDQERLKCYDTLFGPPHAATDVPCPRDHVLCREWDFGPLREESKFGIEPYRPNYALVASWTDNRNLRPYTRFPVSGSPNVDTLDATEIKFQLSFKSLLLTNGNDWDEGSRWTPIPGFDKFRLWFAYTQQSNWQAYDFANSAPFRETNFEPELIASFGRSDANSFWPGALKVLNFGFVHQSNGQGDPWSRSWNRVYAQAGFDFGDFMLLGRVWYRIPESAASDDNLGIVHYVGRGDLVLRGHLDDTMVTVLHRNNFEFHPNRSFTQLDVSPPWPWRILNTGGVRLHLQATTGYGESLIDYNHRQTTVGIGLSFADDPGEHR